MGATVAMVTQEEVQQQSEVGEAMEATPEGLALAQALLMEWWAGVQDATRFGAAKDILTESSTVRRLTTKCVAITTAFLAAYTLSLSYVALPFCERLAGVSGEGKAGNLASSLSIMILLLWKLAVYVTCLCLCNLQWYTALSSHCWRIARGRPTKRNTLGMQVVDIIGGILIGIGLSLQVLVLSFLPYIGTPLVILFSAWSLAFAGFDYRWVNSDVPLEKRLSYFEKHWAYFLGYGSPFCVAYMALYWWSPEPFWVSEAMRIGWMIPFLIILAPKASLSQRRKGLFKFEVFQYARIVRLWLISLEPLLMKVLPTMLKIFMPAEDEAEEE